MTETEKFTLYISGGMHVTRPGSRMEELPVNPESIDVVFEEDVTVNPPSRRGIIENWISTPLICVFIKVYLTALSVASWLGISDSAIVDMLEKSGAQIIKTDQNYHRMLASDRLLWGVSHWAFVCMVLFGLPNWLEFFNPYLSAPVELGLTILPLKLHPTFILLALGFGLVLWLLIAGAIMGLFFITGTTESRNYAIIDQIEQHVNEHPRQAMGCLVVGRAHVPHLTELVIESDLMEIGV